MLWGWDLISCPPLRSREVACGVSHEQRIVIKNKLHITGTNPPESATEDSTCVRGSTPDTLR